MAPLFRYQAIDKQGVRKQGVIDAANKDVAISALQRRGLVVSSVVPVDKPDSLLSLNLDFFNRVSAKDIAILFHQISSMFEAQVSALNIFRTLATEIDNPALKKVLFQIANDIQSGQTLADSMAKHPKVFSKFVISLIRSGEESGKLNEVFEFLSEYLDRTYELSSKARNALIYPAFVILTFFAVMGLMLTTVIPKLTAIIEESGVDIPFYTQIVIALSDFMSNNILLLLIGLAFLIFFIFKYASSEAGKNQLASFRLSIPYVGDMYRKLFLSRIADSLSTSLASGIQLVRATEIAADVVSDPIYEDMLKQIATDIKTGVKLSESMKKYNQFPGTFIAMVKVGEESGDLPDIFKTIAKFYKREVFNAVDTLVSLIEPIMIVLLGLGVGVLLASVLIPIYSISTSL